jgi:hypothetical protein
MSAFASGGLFVLIVIRLWLLLLLGYVLLALRRLINRRGSTHVFVSVFGKCHTTSVTSVSDVRGYDFNRMVVEFTMIAQDRVIPCAISTAAMDDLEDGRSLKPEQRVDQFMRLREVIERQASRKFSDAQAASDRPLILRSNDFPR